MELGRKFIFSVMGMLAVTGLAIAAMVLRQPMPDGAIAAIATMVLAYTGTNVAATYAHASSSTTNRSVTEQITREIRDRRAAAADGTEVTP